MPRNTRKPAGNAVIKSFGFNRPFRLTRLICFVWKRNDGHWRHVVLPGTPEHRNMTEHSATTKKPGTPPKNPEHSQENQEHSQENPEHPKKTRNTPKKTRNTPEKARNTPRKPGTPRKKKQMAHQYVTACVSFSKLPPLITHKIIWFDLHNLENSYKRHTGTIFLPASRFVMCP